MKPIILTALVCAGLLVSLPASATRMYKIVNQDGQVTYTTELPDTSNVKSIQTKDISGGVGDDGSAAGLSRVASKYPVTLYVVDNCSSCNDARSYLKLHGIPFTEKNVNQDLTARAELKQRSGALVVPTILVGTLPLKGFVAAELESQLSKDGYPVGKNAPGNDQDQSSDNGSQDQGQQNVPADNSSQDQGDNGGQ